MHAITLDHNTQSPSRRFRRAKHKSRRINGIITQAIDAIPGTSRRTGSTFMAAIVSSGIALPTDTIVKEFQLAGHAYSLVGIPNADWLDAKSMEPLMRIKAKLATAGIRCVLIPQRAIDELHRAGSLVPAELFAKLFELAKFPLRELNGHGNCHPWHDPVGCYAIQATTGSTCHH